MTKVAAYARYSTNKQNESSIDDQIRRCRDYASKKGLSIDPALIFTDVAVSATKKHADKRHGYNALISACEDRKIDIIISDEISRLVRDPVQKALLQNTIEETGIRLITVSGVDSDQHNWQLTYGFEGLVGEQAIRDTQFRVVRGMVGRLDDGFMIAPLVFGYSLKRTYDSKGKKKGTYWFIDPDKAKVVIDIFVLRHKGMSYNQIARELNEKGIPSPRKNKEGDDCYWRPGTIKRILGNTIYRGIFLWHGSYNHKKKCLKKRRDPETIEYSRPDLQIVNDDLWYACNPDKSSVRRYGGGRHAFSGLVNCGTCNAKLSVSTGGNSPTLYCAQCSQARRVGVDRGRTGHLSVIGLQLVLAEAIKTLFSAPFVLAFQDRLRERSVGRVGDELKLAIVELDRAEKACKRFAKAIGYCDADDQILREEYQESKNNLRRVKNKVDSLKSQTTSVDKEIIKRQLEVRPAEILSDLWKSDVPSERIRALLLGLFDKIVFESKPERFVAIIRVTLAPGVVAAVATNTGPIDTELTTLRFRLSTGARRPTVWAVELLVNEVDTVLAE